MGKSCHNDFLDGALNILKNNVNGMSACATAPTTRTEAAVTNKLADVVMAVGDFTVGDGDTNGRKVAVAQKATVPVDTTGEADHIALYSATILYYVTTCTPQVLTAGNTVTFPTWDIEIADPT